MPRSPDLPDFQKPPLDEIILSIQFSAISNFTTPYIGMLWEEFREKYSRVTEQAPLPTTFETFGPPTVQKSGFAFQQFLTPPMPRYWFETAQDDCPLFQIQQDRVVRNWRRRAPEDVYPRFESIRDEFREEVLIFENWLKKQKLGSIQPNQCEVTYINVIGIPEDGKLADITPLWRGEKSDGGYQHFENVQIQSRFRLLTNNEPIGRVHILIQPALRIADQLPVMRLEITARGRPENSNIDSAFDFLNRARGDVVKTFASVTTPELHRLWGRTQ